MCLTTDVLLLMTTDKCTEAVCDKLRKTAERGLKKYGVTLDRNDLSELEWLVHWQEELMDAAKYVEKLIQLKKEQTVKYLVTRTDEDVILERVAFSADGWMKSEAVTPAASLKVNYLIDGFGFGFCGAGPYQLAIAILLDFLAQKGYENPEQQAHWMYTNFSTKFLVEVEGNSLIITEQQIVEFLNWANSKVVSTKEVK